MGGLSLWHWIIVIAVVLLLFGGRGKISDIMGDFAKGIKSFKKGLAEDETPSDQAPAPTPVETARAEAPTVIEHRREVEVPGAPAAKPRAKAAPKAASKTTTKAAAAKAAPAKTAKAKTTATRKKADS